MPNSASAKKRLRQDDKRRLRNRSVKSALRTQMGKVLQAIKDGDIEACEAQFRLATKKLDQAAAGRVIHRNAAARLKSRLSKKIKAAKDAA